MDLYNYNDDGIYANTTKARPDPLEFGKWLIPRNATTVKPLETGENEVAVFADGVWTVQPDFRGVPFWILPDREPRYQHSLGELPEGAVLELPPLTQGELDEIQADIDRINAILEAQENAGLRNISLEQAEAYIEEQFDTTALDATLPALQGATDLPSAMSAIIAALTEVRNLVVRAKDANLKEIPYLLR